MTYFPRQIKARILGSGANVPHKRTMDMRRSDNETNNEKLGLLRATREAELVKRRHCDDAGDA